MTVKEKIGKNKTIICIIISSIILAISISVIIAVFVNDFEQNVIKDAETISNKIEQTNNKIIYLYEDLVELDESFRNKYTPNSYMVKYKDETIICFSTNQKKAEGYPDNLKIGTIHSDNEQCNFTFFTSLDENYKEKYNIGEVYLYNYLHNKYHIPIYNVKHVDECVLWNCSNGYYDIESSAGNFTAQLEIKNNRIIETDNFHNL